MERRCIRKCSPLGSARRYKTTYILPRLVMRLVENDFIIGNIVVLENNLGFWARRVHMLQASRAQRVKRKGKRKVKGGGDSAGVFNKKRNHRDVSSRNRRQRKARVIMS